MGNTKESVEATANKLIDPVLTKLDKQEKVYSDSEMTYMIGHMTSVLIHRMVLDSLSIRREELGERNEAELRAKVSKKFALMKSAMEGSIIAAFESAVSVAARQQVLYSCSIREIQSAINTMPC